MHSVAIVEDHRLLAETLCTTLRERGSDAEVVELCEPAELLVALIERRPRLVLLDLDLGAIGDSTWLIQPLSSAGIAVLVLTGTGNRLRIATALEQGAVGYQLKSAGFDKLVDKVEAALSRGGLLDPVEHAQLLDELGAARMARARGLEPFLRLTERERGTLQALAHGQTVRDIAQDWVLSEATVRTHVRSVLTKLNVPSQLAAVSMALRSGWLDAGAQVVTPAAAVHPLRRASDVYQLTDTE